MTKRGKSNKSRGLEITVKIFNIIAAIACLLFVFGAGCLVAGGYGEARMENFVQEFSAVDYGDDRPIPVYENGGYTFHTDGSLKVMQLTDVHLGMGAFSITEDLNAINAVGAMINAEKPDLVIFTGDQVFAIPVWSANVDNLKGYVVIAELMERLGVYWTFTFGNHDAETYDYYSKAELCEHFEKTSYTYCLFERGDSTIDGYGNHYINVKNQEGLITQSLIILDSHDYVDDDALGIKWHYDNIHPNQIEWYESTVKYLTAVNARTLGVAEESYDIPVKSLLFFHIPIAEYQDAYDAYISGNADAKYYYGVLEDSGIFCGTSDDEVFESCLRIKSTQGIFCGHDHLNNFSIEYKGIRLTYGMSIDYLAYFGIDKTGRQRGCTLIYVHTDGNFDCEASNYYQEKYVTLRQKESVKDLG